MKGRKRALCGGGRWKGRRTELECEELADGCQGGRGGEEVGEGEVVTASVCREARERGRGAGLFCSFLYKVQFKLDYSSFPHI